MKILFFIIVVLHGLIHLLGFIKAFRIGEIKGLTIPVSRPAGIVWLLATLLFIVYGLLRFACAAFDWAAGFGAVAISQFLIIRFWKDARFGTIINVLVLIISLVSYGNYSFRRLTEKETADILIRKVIPEMRIMTEDDIGPLPAPVQRWLRRSGAMGKAPVTHGKIVQKAELKMSPDQEEWLRATAVQYSVMDPPSFIWTVDVYLNRFIYFKGRDKFSEGKGAMLIKVNSLFNVVNEKGDKLDEATIQRFLGEMVWFPSLAVSRTVAWQQINDTAALATMSYLGTRGSGTFYFNRQGDFVKFSAMRYMGNDKNDERKEWILTVYGYKTFQGIKVPASMSAAWKLPEGDWTWLKLEIEDIKYNEDAGI